MATESIQPYTTARVNYLASYLQTLLPGLDKTVATTWITAEKGVSGNVLGTTYTSGGTQHLYTYPSQEAGLRAAAGWINSNPRYSGVKSSLSSSAAAQATALSTSGWNNSYYPSVFASITGHSSTPSGGVSTPTVPTGAYTTKFLALLTANHISTDPTHIISATEANTIVANFAQFFGAGGHPLAANFTGQTVGSISGTIQSSGSTIAQASPLSGINLDIPGALMFVAVILVGIAFLALGGIIVLKRPK
jgi:hypothetical protein